MKLEKLLCSITLIISASRHYNYISIFDILYYDQIATSPSNYNLSKDPNKMENIKKILNEVKKFTNVKQLAIDDTWFALFFHYFLPYHVFEDNRINPVPNNTEIKNLISRSNELSKILKEACSASSIDFNSVLVAFVYENTELLNKVKNSAEVKDKPSTDERIPHVNNYFLDKWIVSFSNNTYSFASSITEFDNALNSDDFSLINDRNMFIQFSKYLNYLSNFLYHLENRRVEPTSFFRSKVIEFLNFYSELEKKFYESLLKSSIKDETNSTRPLNFKSNRLQNECNSYLELPPIEGGPTSPAHMNFSNGKNYVLISQDEMDGEIDPIEFFSKFFYHSNQTSPISSASIIETKSGLGSTGASINDSSEAKPELGLKPYGPSNIAVVIDAEQGSQINHSASIIDTKSGLGSAGASINDSSEAKTELGLNPYGPSSIAVVIDAEQEPQINHCKLRCKLLTSWILFIFILLLGGGIVSFFIYYFLLRELAPELRDILKYFFTAS